MTEDDYMAKTEEYGDEFKAMMGAEAIKELLATINIDEEVEDLRRELSETTSEAKVKKIAKRLKVLEGFQRSGIKPEWMVWMFFLFFRRIFVRWFRSTAAVSPQAI